MCFSFKHQDLNFFGDVVKESVGRMNVSKLMDEHKRLLKETTFGAWDIFYELQEYVKKKGEI